MSTLGVEFEENLVFANQVWPKNIANPRHNSAELFFANLKAKENEENARKSEKKALALAEIAKQNEEKAQSNEARADEYAFKQKLSVKWVWFWFSPTHRSSWKWTEVHSTL